MKIYIKPAIDVYDLITEETILTASQIVRNVDVDDEGIDEIDE